MSPTLLFFLFGVLAGFLLFRLGRRRDGRATPLLTAAGWIVAAASLALAAALFGYALWSL